MPLTIIAGSSISIILVVFGAVLLNQAEVQADWRPKVVAGGLILLAFLVISWVWVSKYGVPL